MRFDPRELRTCLGHFATGVTVITYEVDGEPRGATVNAFTAVSLDPPLVLAALDRSTTSRGYLAGRPFTANVLRARQDDIALHFAGQPLTRPLDWVRSTEGLAPRLPGSLAYIACAPWDSYDGGDHVLFLGEVRRFEYYGGEPLLFYGGKFRHLGPAFETVPWLESADFPGLSWFPRAG